MRKKRVPFENAVWRVEEIPWLRCPNCGEIMHKVHGSVYYYCARCGNKVVMSEK